MIKKHEKLFIFILTILFCLSIIVLIQVRRRPDQNPGIQLSQLPQLSDNYGIVNGKIDINTADAEVLQLIPGIGPGLSARIIEHREENGKYLSTEDLMDVKGIGEKTYQKILPYITTGG